MENNLILMKIKEDVGFIKGELKGMNTHLGKINGCLDNHGERINHNEDKINYILGGIAILGFIITAVIVLFK